MGDKYGKRLIFTKKKMGAQTAEANDNAARQERDMGVSHSRDWYMLRSTLGIAY